MFKERNQQILLIVFTFLFIITGLLSASGAFATNNFLKISPILPDGLGVNIHFIDPRPGEMTLLANAGFRWIRVEISWEATENQKGKYNFSAYEKFLNILEKYNIRPILILGYTNPFYDGGLSPYTEQGRVAFSTWAAAAAVHFKDRGVLWEMYNEPEWAWRPRTNYSDDYYIKLALKVGQTIHKIAPKEIFIGPAASNISLSFLEKCFKANLLRYWAAVTVHPYRGTNPETVIKELRLLRKLVNKYSMQNRTVSIISSEWGYPSIPYRENSFNDQLQSKYISRALLTNISNGVDLSIWYDWSDDGTDLKNSEHHFGIVRNAYRANKNPVLEPKPAFFAIKTLTESFNGCYFDERLNTGKPDDYILKFRSKKTNQELFAVWSSSGNSHKVFIPIHSRKFWIVTNLGHKKLLEASKMGFSVNLSDSPQYLIPEIQ
jgi:polysaccharide biosynthesis protein PslG